MPARASIAANARSTFSGAEGAPGDRSRPPRAKTIVDRDQDYRDNCLAMMSFMISDVPPPIVKSRMSRKNRSIGYSRM